MSARDAHLIQALGQDVVEKINKAKVLIVGAGGIGCELLKNLVLSGFHQLEVIDLDTIDVSNLNRQFLFRPHHVGQPKALVARQAALMFNPRATITAYHANIKEARFGVEYFRGFDLVINALDNVAARKHVNRLCLATGRPLVEAGTAGYLGQAYPIRKGVTECFECTPPPAQKTFPICTIRSTPDKPVHCVVWAKELHKLLFGEAQASYLYEAEAEAAGGAGAEAAGAAGGAGAEAAGAAGAAGAGAAAARAESVYMHVVEAAPKGRVDAADPAALAALDAWGRALFDAVFGAEISKRLSMAPDTFKTAAVPPQPLYLAEVEAGAHEGGAGAAAGAAAPAEGQLADQRVLSLRESAALLLSSLRRFYTDADAVAALGAAAFSKDSALDLDFVTAAANLRAATFGIPRQSRFAVKSIAGNIIPAIATTNAMVAGLEVLEAIKALRGDDMAATGRATHICTAPAATNKLLLATGMGRPRADCFACGTRGVTLFIDTHRTSLRTLIDVVLKERLGFAVPNVDNGEAFNFVEEREAEEDEEEYAQKLAFLPLPMAELVGGGLRSGTIATVTDFSQDKATTVTIVHRDRGDFDELKHPQVFELVGEAEAASTQAALDAETAAVKQKQREAAAGQEVGAGAGAQAGSSSAGSGAGAAPAVGSKRSRAQAGADSVSVSGAAAQPSGASADAGDVDLLGSSDEEGAAGRGSASTGPAKRARIDTAAAAGPGAKAGGTGSGGGDASAAAAEEQDVVVLDD